MLGTLLDVAEKVVDISDSEDQKRRQEREIAAGVSAKMQESDSKMAGNIAKIGVLGALAAFGISKLVEKK